MGRPRRRKADPGAPLAETTPAVPATRRQMRVLVVDDVAEPRELLARALATLGHEVETASDGIEALARLGLGIDLVLLDAQMQEMDGFEVARRIRADPVYQDLPIIMVTGLDGQEDRLRAVEAGINDFITKPFEITELRLRSASLLRMKQATDALKRHRAQLERAVTRRTAELRRALEETLAAQQSTATAHRDTIRRLVIAAEYKDRETAAHTRRIGTLSAVLARHLVFAPGDVDVIHSASEMHDVGKIGIPDAILLKTGPLTPAERQVMNTHTLIGARILHGSASPLLQVGERIALAHHERWDGAGYPSGTAGDQIPLPARICAVADVFDALTSDRPYRPALPNESAYEMMRAERARHFDPHVLDVFLDRRAEAEQIQHASRGPAHAAP